MTDFFDSIRKNPEYFGVWEENDKSTIIKFIESAYNKQVIREHLITDLVMNSNKILVKWNKRHRPLTDEELKTKYGV